MTNLPTVIRQPLEVGQVVEVGQFFWADVLWHEPDARHGHKIKTGTGSVAVGCTLTIRGFEGDKAVVRLDRPETPYGAPAAIGSVFLIDADTIKAWPSMLQDRREREKWIAKMKKKYRP